MRQDTMDPTITIRPEQPEDVVPVHALLERAFKGPAEAELVRRLRAAGAMTLALTALLDTEHSEHSTVVGHIAFSPVSVAAGRGRSTAVGLAPMAVIPERQRQGIGTALVQTGLERLRAEGYTAVVVLGHPHYYPRFGFRPAGQWGLRWEHHAQLQGHEDAFMALELEPGALEAFAVSCGGIVRFRPEFDGL